MHSSLINGKGLKAEEAAIVSKPSNIFYLSGYTGEGLALVAQGIQAIITDFRYVEQAEQEAPAFETLGIAGSVSLLQKAYEACVRAGIRTVYYEDDEFTVRAYHKAVAVFEGMEFKPLGNEIEQLRRIKDADEISRVERACKISGESFERILPQIREGMTEKELARMLEFDMLEHGADKMGFSVIAAAGRERIQTACGAIGLPNPQGRYDHDGFRREGAGLHRRHDPHGGAWHARRGDAKGVRYRT